MGDGRKALQQSSKGGPRGRSPIQPRDLLNERNQRPRVDGRRASIRQLGRRTDRRGWYQRHAAISPASAAAKFRGVPSMAALAVGECVPMMRLSHPIRRYLATWRCPLDIHDPATIQSTLRRLRRTTPNNHGAQPESPCSSSPTGLRHRIEV
jgi:hypothetical protein